MRICRISIFPNWRPRTQSGTPSLKILPQTSKRERHAVPALRMLTQAVPSRVGVNCYLAGRAPRHYRNCASWKDHLHLLVAGRPPIGAQEPSSQGVLRQSTEPGRCRDGSLRASARQTGSRCRNLFHQSGLDERPMSLARAMISPTADRHCLGISQLRARHARGLKTTRSWFK